MFGAQIRAARIARGITETRLAREAGIQRSQVVDLEENRNVTTETLRRVLEQLPSITHLTLPTREPETVDAAIVRGLASRLIATANQLLAVTGTTPVPAPDEPPAGSTPSDEERFPVP